MSLQNLPEGWDVIVAGAGIAGSVTAYRLARHGLRVLLAEKSAWPRDKACGGCLNKAALQALKQVGLGEVAHEGQRYFRIRLGSGQQRAVLPLPEGRAVSRRHLDQRLAQRAQEVGVTFLTGTQVMLMPTIHSDENVPERRVMLRQGQESVMVSARLVIGCDGLGSRLLREDAPQDMTIARNSRIGVGTTLSVASAAYSPGSIHMACAKQGYVGLVRVEEGRLNIGAALDPAWVKRCGGPGAAVTRVLRQANFPRVEGLGDADWHGTPQLTRQRIRLGGDRVLVLGDAAGYVEPFTGEGMSWAVASAAAVEPVALRAVARWEPALITQWTERHARLIRTRQRGCRSMAALLRRPRLVEALLPMANTLPGVVRPLTAWLNRAYRFENLGRHHD